MDLQQIKTVSLAPSSLGSEEETALAEGRRARDDSLPAQVGRYRLAGEIARGGMGRIVRIHDDDFDRPLAMKVLLGQGSELEERFLREARLTGVLQHPGIPPVHALGRLDDGRPFFVMKLINGLSLQALLKERASTAVELPRFVAIFEQICQTVGYAHAQGVIHRDLKPGNVMVGAFAEVQVLDWGLAKILKSTSSKDSVHPAEHEGTPEPVWSGAIADSGADQTLPGRALGTPSYMAPEQARGEVDNIDFRADVFGLGAILCEILTGAPPFTGTNVVDVMCKAAEGDLSTAGGRLQRSGADAELVALARRCLAPAKEDRPPDGSAVAAAVAEYQAELARRLRQAEIERAAADARANEEKKLRAAEEAKARAERTRRRSTVLALAACLVLLLAGSAAALWYREHQAQQARQQARAEQAADESLEQARNLHEQLHKELREAGAVRALLNQPVRWETQIQAAVQALAKARSLLSTVAQTSAPEFASKFQDLETLLQQDEHDRKIAMRLEKIRADIAQIRNGSVDVGRTAREYPAVFADAGLPVLSGDVEEMARQIRSSPIKEQLVGALDAWAMSAKQAKKTNAVERVLELSRRADPDAAWTDRFRRPEIWQGNREALRKLVNEAPLPRMGPQLCEAVFFLMESDPDLEEHWLRQAQAQHPKDFWLNVLLGRFLREKRGAPAEAEGFFWTAMAIRPNTPLIHLHLGIALQEQRRLDDAVTAYQKSIQLDPSYATPHFWLARTYYDQERYVRAEAEARRATELASDFEGAHHVLGLALAAQNRLPQAVDAYKKAIDLDPFFHKAYYNLGLALLRQGLFDEAAKQTQECLKRTAPGQDGQALAVAQLKECERYQRLKKRLPEALSGAIADTGELLAMAEMCGKFLNDPRRAVQLYERAFNAAPKLADDFEAMHRYGAACAAAAAGADKQLSGTTLLTSANTDLRRRAHGWLEEELKSYRRLLKEGKQRELAIMESRLTSWHEEPALAGLRESSALARLPEKEQRQWQGLWGEAARLLADAKQTKRFLPAGPFYGALTARQAGKVREMQLSADKVYLIDLESKQFDTLLQVKDSQGKLLAENDDISPRNLNSRLVFSPPRDGTYQVIATSYQQRGSGSFTLTVRSSSAPSSETVLRGQLSAKEQDAVHHLQASSDRLYVIHVQSNAFDPVLQLKDQNGTVLEENDDIGPNDLNARVIFFPPRTADYSMLVRSHRQRGQGLYTVTIRSWPWHR